MSTSCRNPQTVFDWARECPGDFSPTVPTDPRAAIYAAANRLAKAGAR